MDWAAADEGEEERSIIDSLSPSPAPTTPAATATGATTVAAFTPPILSAAPPPPSMEKTATYMSLRSASSSSSIASSTAFPLAPLAPPSTLLLLPAPTLEKTDFNSFSRAQQRISFSGITNSEAHGEMYKERMRGSLYKRGFRFRKRWVARWVVLTGRMLRYYSAPRPDDDIASERGSIELTSDTVVSFEHFSLSGEDSASTNTNKVPQQFGFVVFIRGHDKSTTNSNSATTGSSSHNTPWYVSDTDKWCFRATSEQDREAWMRCIARVVQLIRRADMVPTLVGVGRLAVHFDLERELGRGRYGPVRLATAKSNAGQFAIRIVHKHKILDLTGSASSPSVSSSSSKHYSPAWEREHRILKRIHGNHASHRNLVYLYFCFDEPQCLYFVKDLLLYGSLERRIPVRDERLASNVVHQLASALAVLHDMGVVVLDLAPHKLLFQNELTIKINDFGQAHHVAGEFATLTDHSVEASTLAGYVAPELLTHKQVSKQCDLWALGVLLAHMVTGIRPFAKHDDVRRGQPLHFASSTAPSAACLDLVHRLTVPNRVKRMQTAQDVLGHAFTRRRLFTLRSIARSVLAWVVLARRVIPRRRQAPPPSQVAAASIAPPALGLVSPSFAGSRLSLGGGIRKTKSYTEIRNEQWTMDALAKRTRDEGLGSSESFLMLNHRSSSSSNATGTGFTGIGISSSVAGQLSEYGELAPVVSKPGPFMSLLEGFLDDEADGWFEEGEEEEEEEKERHMYGAPRSSEDEEEEEEERRSTSPSPFPSPSS